MFISHFKMAWRSLVKDRQFTILNLVGLASGLACALMIYLWIVDERNVDKYNSKDEQLYQVMQNIPHENGIETIEHTPGLLANGLAKEMPEVEFAATVVPASWFSSKGIISTGETKLKTGGQFVSADYFNIFNCPIIGGNKETLFADRQSIAISDELSEKIFRKENPIGKTIEWTQDDFNGTYRIIAVFKKNPVNASERFDILFNYALFEEKRPTILAWGNSDPSTYVLLKKRADVGLFNSRLKDYLKTKDRKAGSTLFTRRFSDKYLYGQYTDGVPTGGRIAYIKLFGATAVFILAIACINFMNLSTARAARRMKEVGIQKAMGASRSRLILQYLSESVLTSFFALLLAVVLIAALMPAFNSITGKSLSFDLNPSIITATVAITFVTGLIAGSYPALYISGFRPVAVLKGQLKTSIAELWTRKGLVVFQFALSIFAIATVLIIYRQAAFIQSKNLGYKRDNLIHFDLPIGFDSDQLASASSFINELKKIPGVTNVSSYYHNLTGGHGNIGDFSWPGKDPNTNIDFVNLEVGDGFIETVGIKMKEGRSLRIKPGEFFSPSNEIVFNESAIKAMGLSDPIGKMVKFWDRQRVIVGVTEDFHFESLYEKVKPCFFQAFPVMPNIIVKIKAGTEKQSLARIRTIFEQFNKGLAFDYRFMDEDYQAMYQSENRVAALSKYFAGLAILISCLGLFGLAAFTAQKRQKEIGIRKVVGASVSGVVFMLSKGFLQLIFIAALIALPLVWLTMTGWLNGFAYRTSIPAGIFVVTVASILLITLITVSVQSLKAALMSPVKSLRNE
ncbi:ABC transporter permease [Terrimonas sp. NA20]|uniref:ABC transporter permease n=1 Tax=Terrimonas ginsenosidimutans TaxID=2908004 RepID=A0ABS9KKU6_9BACT|nr:ABC transporter permease [Terrimonas ginsenosidimutans]MCG2612946.1 ABC transporter permease [Terrimonas ginsenosidimutans]